MVRRSFSAAAGILLALGAAAPATAAGDLTLDKVVVLMRHGVRPPTSTKAIEPFAAKPWPKWDVADGMLTPHGAEAVGRLGAWEGQMLATRGLLNAPACPKPGEVFPWASGALQRTVDTGNALLAAMFPDCGLTVGHGDAKDADPLFTASDTDLGRLDPEKGRAAILAAMGGSFDTPEAAPGAAVSGAERHPRLRRRGLRLRRQALGHRRQERRPQPVARRADRRRLDHRPGVPAGIRQRPIAGPAGLGPYQVGRGRDPPLRHAADQIRVFRARALHRPARGLQHPEPAADRPGRRRFGARRRHRGRAARTPS